MTFTVKLSPTFERQAKALFAKFPALKSELHEYLTVLESQAPRGEQVQRHRMIWKDRLGIKAHQIGKRGGLRVLMYFDGSSLVCPLMIYYKPDLSQPTDKEIRAAASELLELL